MKKLFLIFFLSAFILTGFGLGQANAQTTTTPTFPPGCTSALGYSVTNGSPCNGTNTATLSVPGCTTALGYSIINGVPCSGGPVAIQYLAGCTSIYGYSTISNVPCNGTTVASDPNTPGLPTTGAGGNASTNLFLLTFTAGIALIGSFYIFRKYIF